ncbi:MAG: ferrous iron transporter B, partial [Pseudomonadota bacterium]
MLRLALIGAPNSGKSSLFNALTGGRSKVGNYPGVTVEERRAPLRLSDDSDPIELIDLPGIYGMSGRSLDERVALDAVSGKIEGTAAPDALLVVLDAASLRTHLQTVLEARRFGLPMIVALNMMDLAERDGVELDVDALAAAIGAPVVPTVAVRRAGRDALLKRLAEPMPPKPPEERRSLEELQREARQIADRVFIKENALNSFTQRLDAVALHPVGGLALLAGILFLMFQAVYAWANAPMDLIDAGFGALTEWVGAALPEGWLSSLLVDGVIAGVGSVVIFLPQILILFLFILALESSGYMARAAFLMDALMARVGLNGRALIPLLSSFACAIPGIMAARSIESERDRLTTILVAPLMTCSARLPVYTVIIGAFIPNQTVGGFLNAQGLALFGLYVFGALGAIAVAFILRQTVTKGAAQPLILEIPSYKAPNLLDLTSGLWTRAWIFLKRAGTIILASVIVLWALASFPATDEGVRGSLAGTIGSVFHFFLAPIGFNLEIAIALVPGMAAREVAVGALGSIYALSGSEDEVAQGLEAVLQ